VKQGRMYRIKRLHENKRNTCMAVGRWDKDKKLETADPNWSGSVTKYYDGDLVACLGSIEMRTHHYEPQVFYKVLTLKGEVATISKGNRNKYFELVK